MKTKYSLILVAALVFNAGCLARSEHPSLLEGFDFSSLKNLHANKTIMDDYQDYISKLPPEERKRANPIFYFEDGTGNHAVSITIGLKGTVWQHVLIYDKDNRRIKTVKYRSGNYMS